MEFDFRLGLILLLGGLAVYLLGFIREMSANDPTNESLLFLGFLHFMVFVYLCLALLSFYAAGLTYFLRAAENFPGKMLVDTVLFGTWPIIFIALLLSFVTARLNFPGAYKAFFFVFYVVIVAGVVALYFLSSRQLPSNWQPVFLFLCAMPAGFTVYLFMLSAFLADVDVKTDKDFYRADEEVRVALRPTGYILRPSVTRISCGLFDISGGVGTNHTIVIPPDKHVGSEFIKVELRPQIIPLRLTRFHYLRIERR